MKEVLWADILGAKVVCERKGLLLKHVAWGLIFKPSFACVFWYRVNRWMYIKKCPPIMIMALSVWRFYRFGNDISYLAQIGDGLMVGHVHGIVIGGNVKIGKRCLVRHGVTIGAAHNSAKELMPRLGDDVEIGAGTVVVGGIHIGNKAILGTMSLINKDVEEGGVIYGIPPHQTIKRRN